MSLTVGDLVARMKLDKDGFTAGLTTSKEQFAKFGSDVNTGIQNTGANWGFLGRFIQSQAQGSGTGLLDLTKKFAMLGAMAGAGSLVAGGAMAALPFIAAGVAGKILAQNTVIKADYTALGQHIKTQMTADVKSLVPVAEQTAKQLGAAFNQINPEIKQAFAALGPEIQPLVAGLTGLLSGMMPGLVAGLQSAMPIVKALSSGLSALGQGLGGFFTALTDGANAAASGLSSILNMLGDFLPVLGQVIATLASVGGPLLQALMPVIEQLLLALSSALIPTIQQLAPVFLRIVQAISPVVDALGSILQAASPVIVALGGSLAVVLDQLSGTLVQVLDAVEPLIPALVNMLGPITPLVPVFAQIIAQLATGLSPILVQLLPILGAILSAFEQLIASGLESLLAAIMPLLPPLGQLAVIIAQALLKALTTVAPAFLKIFQALVPVLAPIGSLLGLLQKLGPILPLIVEGFLAFKVITTLVTVFKIVQSGFTAMTAILSANPFVAIAIAVAAIVILIIANWTHIKGFLSDVWHAIASTAISVWHSVTGFFGDVVRDIGNVLGGMARLGEHLWDWIGSGLKAVVNGVLHGINWMIDRINDLTSGLSSLWSWAGIPAIGKIGHIPYLASGGLTTKGGLARVGEGGAETVALPAGAAVFPHGSEPGGAGNGGGTAPVIQISGPVTGFDALAIAWLKAAIRKRGGNPAVLGP